MGRVAPSGDRPTVPREVAKALLERLGWPCRWTPTVHVAGTKGKGSVSALCDSVLRSAGYRTGLFTNPSLHTWRERIVAGGEPISAARLQSLLDRLEGPLTSVMALPNVEVKPFELSVALALLDFEDQATQFNVIEVGIGGLRDATNIVNPTVSVITAVGLDHVGVIGNSLEEIAAEKAGIIKPGRPVVASPQEPSVAKVLRAAATGQGSRLVEVGSDVTWEPRDVIWPTGSRVATGQRVTVHGRLDSYDVTVPLLGQFQLENVATAIAALEVLREEGYDIHDEAFARGIASLRWPGRLEVLDAGAEGPVVVADVAHNPLAAARLRTALPEYLAYDKVALIVDVSTDHDARGVVTELTPMRPQVVVARSRLEKSSAPEPLTTFWREQGIEPLQADSPEEALPVAKKLAGPRGLVLATGTFSVAAAVRETVYGIVPEFTLPF